MAIEKTTFQTTNLPTQKLILDNREHLSVTGVENIENFTDNEIILHTNLGKLTIKGENLHISKMNVDTGEFSMDGRVTSFVYSKMSSKKGSFIERLFK